MVGENSPVDDDVGEQEEQPPKEPPVVPQLRRSTRVSQPSKKYPYSEYIMLTDGG